MLNANAWIELQASRSSSIKVLITANVTLGKVLGDNTKMYPPYVSKYQSLINDHSLSTV